MKTFKTMFVVIAAVMMMCIPVHGKTCIRETVGNYTISVNQSRKKTSVKWNGKTICSFNFTGKVKLISERKFSYQKRVSRKNKILYIERTVGVVVDNAGNGKTSDGGYISYKKMIGKIHKGDVIVTYCVYNPFTHWIDDIVERYDAIVG